jgi:hypothetical protein
VTASLPVSPLSICPLGPARLLLGNNPQSLPTPNRNPALPLLPAPQTFARGEVSFNIDGAHLYAADPALYNWAITYPAETGGWWRGPGPGPGLQRYFPGRTLFALLLPGLGKKQGPCHALRSAFYEGCQQPWRLWGASRQAGMGVAMCAA